MNIEQMEPCLQDYLQDAVTNTMKTISALKETTTSAESTCCMKSTKDISKHTQLPLTTSSSVTNNPLLRQEGGGHYKDMVIQPVTYIHANNIPFLEGNIIKYVSRWRNKNGLADLKKAKHCIELLISFEENK